MPTQGGSIRLFRFKGIDVYLHWSWFLIAFYEVQVWRGMFSSPAWAFLLCVGVFGLVTLHEFGHAFACRQVGGRADRIILWPLGGIAFVSPPPRAGAMLWSIAAGPLVNLLLLPILSFAVVAGKTELLSRNPNVYHVLEGIWEMNGVVLFFNLLPIYPLDGGQMLRSLLWFRFGPVRSLFIASGVGFIGAILLGLLAFLAQYWWLGVMAFFLLSQAAVGWRQAQFLKFEAVETETRTAPTGARLPEKKMIS
jgi:Zn-dependent protease